MQYYLVLAALITLSISIFAIQNSQEITLQFLYWILPPLPLVLVILFSAAMGVLITLLFNIARQFRMTMQIRELQSRLKQMEKKLSGADGPVKAEQGSPPKNQPVH